MNKQTAEKIEQTITDSNFEVPERQSVEIYGYSDTDSDNIDGINQMFNASYGIYKDILSPQLQKNEELKRKQKKQLMDNIFKLLKTQFIATYILIFGFIIIIALNQKFGITQKTIIQIFDFLKFYITTIIAELIAILFFIVKNVFDKSIVDLFKNFDKNRTESKHK